MMALTMSFWLFLRARTALKRDTPACDMTNSMSFASTPLSSTYKSQNMAQSPRAEAFKGYNALNTPTHRRTLTTTQRKRMRKAKQTRNVSFGDKKTLCFGMG